ncbi:MAG: cation-translocating P-type ATPase [Anaerolineales bacterium]|jgi:Ca2+-transporting ATPase
MSESKLDHWHELPVRDVLERLNVDPVSGLQNAEIKTRQLKHGLNELTERGFKSPWKILWEQLTSVMVVVLFIAAFVSALLSDWLDAIVILAIVVINAILGFIQEYRAERAIAALKRMAAPTVKVRRNGELQRVEARELVPGDVVMLEAGSAVPADGRLVECANLRVQEASLTGESIPVDKTSDAIRGENIPVGDRHNMVFMGTIVTYGRGVTIITETGMRTELGRIADLIQTVEPEKTPLQRRMEQLGKTLAVVAVGIVAVVFGIGVFQGEQIKELFLTSVAMAVAAVPEGLAAVVTISLALGAQRMLKRRALIRKLPSVESLGSVTVICSDKTGTLTENRMTVKILDVAGHTADITQPMIDGHPFVDTTDEELVLKWRSQALMLAGGSLCNDAELKCEDEKTECYHTIGDPTEGALLIAAARFGLWKNRLERLLPRVDEIPFSSERKRMTTLHHLDSTTQFGPQETLLEQVLSEYAPETILFTKGAVDGLLEISSRVWVSGKIEPLTDEWRERVETASDQLSESGLRVLGIALSFLDQPAESFMRPSDNPDAKNQLERDLVFIGMVGMIDPPRPEVKDAVLTCKSAGIRPVMITGDHPLTARAIAQDLNIAVEGSPVLTGQELDKLSKGDLDAIVEDVSVYARVSPEHKLTIVEALQNRGHIVAMTGDGVNDAPALRKSDIGIAMGITGTDVSKEAADMVITDDNFARIVSAIEEGRTIYDNVRKFIKYTLTSNAGEILVMLIAPFLGMPLPLTALQILWVNLVTDGLPGLALGVEAAEPNTMQRPPYSPTENIFSRGMGPQIGWVGLLMGLISLAPGFWAWKAGLATWQTMVFTTLTLSQMGNVFATRSSHHSIFKIGFFSNKALIGAVMLVFILQGAVTYWRPLQTLFGTQALNPLELVICLSLSTLVFWSIELEKWIRRK